MVSNIQEVRARGAKTIVIAEEGDEAVKAYAEHVFYIPETPTLLAPLLSTVPLQIFALRPGLRQGLRRGPASQPGQERDRRITP